jgi:excisionase family DNA binding protein
MAESVKNLDMAIIRKIVREVINSTMPPEYFTPEELADTIQIDATSIRRWARTGQLPYTRFGKYMRIKADDWIKFCDERTVD